MNSSRRWECPARQPRPVAKMGVKEEHNLHNKVARGKFTAAFFLQCLTAIGVQTLRLQEE
jgi:hypothetical protein